MYLLAKLAEATGLTVVGIGFISAFPRLLSPKVFVLGAMLFIFGWIVEKFLLRR